MLKRSRPVTGHAAADTTSSLEGRSHRAPVRRRRDLESVGHRGGERMGGTSTHDVQQDRAMVGGCVATRAGGEGGEGWLTRELVLVHEHLVLGFLLSLGSSTFALALHNTLARFRKKVPRSQRFGWRREILRGGLRSRTFPNPFSIWKFQGPAGPGPRHQHPNQHGAAEG